MFAVITFLLNYIPEIGTDPDVSIKKKWHKVLCRPLIFVRRPLHKKESASMRPYTSLPAQSLGVSGASSLPASAVASLAAAPPTPI